MPKAGFIPQKLAPWIEARRRYRLSHAQVQMARELGMNPKKLGKIANHDQEPWKLPLSEFIEHCYEKQFHRKQPQDIRSIEQREAEKRARKSSCRTERSEMSASASAHAMTHLNTEEPLIRGFLLAEVLRFVERARACPGVRRIALVGSLARDKDNPKDADVLVTVDDDADLTPLATAGRRLKGRAQSRNKGADIFLADPSGKYIGRTCHWRECYPGIRISCDAQHCGRRAFLHDDLDAVMLDTTLVQAPPLDLWPKVVRRVELPTDVETQLVQPIESSRVPNEVHGIQPSDAAGRSEARSRPPLRGSQSQT